MSSMLSDVSLASMVPGSLRGKLAEFRRYLRARSTHTVGPSVGRLLAKDLGEAFAVHYASKPPINPLQVAKNIGIDVQFAPNRNSGQLGQLETRVGGFFITVYGQHENVLEKELDSGFQRAHPELTKRARFTVAHELAHTLFFDEPSPDAHPVRVVPAPTTRSEYWREEGLCNEFASSFLIPRRCESLVAVEPSFSALIAATEAFRVSREVFLRRALYDWNLWPNFLAANISLGQVKPMRCLLLGKHARGSSKDWKMARKRIQDIAASALETSDLRFVELESIGFRCEIVSRGTDLWVFVTG